MSCDAYADIWPYFFHYFWKAWSDCPYPIYLGSTTRQIDDNRVHSVLSGEDGSWSDSVIRCVSQIQTKYILVILEDFFLERRVHSEVIEECRRIMEGVGAIYCRMRPDGARLTGVNWQVPSYIKAIRHTNPYRISTQVSLWNRKAFLEHLVPGESPWQFEIRGSSRTKGRETGYLCTTYPVFKYDSHGALVRGRWTEKGLRMARKLSPEKLMPVRQRLSILAEAELLLQRVLFSMVLRMSPNLVFKWNARNRHY